MKKAIAIIVLGLLWCNVGFGGVSREDNVSLFGIILGDDVDNYETFFKHYSDPSCINVTSKFFPSDCYRPSLKSYVSFRSIVTPLIKNKEYAFSSSCSPQKENLYVSKTGKSPNSIVDTPYSQRVL